MGRETPDKAVGDGYGHHEDHDHGQTSRLDIRIGTVIAPVLQFTIRAT
jgi:hypothetical protein